MDTLYDNHTLQECFDFFTKILGHLIRLKQLYLL